MNCINQKGLSVINRFSHLLSDWGIQIWYHEILCSEMQHRVVWSLSITYVASHPRRQQSPVTSMITLNLTPNIVFKKNTRFGFEWCNWCRCTLHLHLGVQSNILKLMFKSILALPCRSYLSDIGCYDGSVGWSELGLAWPVHTYAVYANASTCVYHMQRFFRCGKLMTWVNRCWVCCLGQWPSESYWLVFRSRFGQIWASG
jgi:hypothetical protein